MATIILAILVCSLPLLKASSEDFKQIIENADYFYNDLMKKYGKLQIKTSVFKNIHIFLYIKLSCTFQMQQSSMIA